MTETVDQENKTLTETLGWLHVGFLGYAGGYTLVLALQELAKALGQEYPGPTLAMLQAIPGDDVEDEQWDKRLLKQRILGYELTQLKYRVLSWAREHGVDEAVARSALAKANRKIVLSCPVLAAALRNSRKPQPEYGHNEHHDHDAPDDYIDVDHEE